MTPSGKSVGVRPDASEGCVHCPGFYGRDSVGRFKGSPQVFIGEMLFICAPLLVGRTGVHTLSSEDPAGGAGMHRGSIWLDPRIQEDAAGQQA